jgi:hypothetical protein
MRQIVKKTIGAAAVGLLSASAAAAPSSSGMSEQQITAEELIAALEQYADYMELFQPLPPATNYGVNPGFGMSRGTLAFSGSYTDEGATSGNDDDGSIGMAIGLGDPNESIGVDLTMGILSTALSDFGEDGTLGVKLHRRFGGLVDGGVSSVAVGVSRAARWGSADATDPNYYGAFSTLIPTPNGGPATMVTVGYGSNADEGGTSEGIYGGVGVGWNQHLNTSVSWTSEQMIASVGFKPFLDRNFMLTVGMGDVTDEVDNRRFLLTAAWFVSDLF